MANVKISGLTPIDLSYTGDLNPQELIANLYLVGDYTYVGESEDNTETGVAYGDTLANAIFDYLTYIPESDNYSMLGYEIYSGVSSYVTSYLSKIADHQVSDGYFGILALEDDHQVYRVGRITEEDIIRGYLYNFMPEPFPASALDGTNDRFLFVNTGLSYIYNVTLSDLVSYIKSH